MEDISYRDYANLITDLEKAKLLIENIDKDFTTMRQQCYHCAKQHHIFDEDHNAVFQLYTEMDFIEEILETECFQYYQLCQWAQKQVTNMPIQIKQLLNNDPNLDLQIQNYLKSIKPIGQIGNTYLDIHNNNYEGSIEWFNNLQKLCLDKTISDGQNSILNFITFQADQKGDFYYQQWTKLRSLLFSKFLASFKQNFPYFKDVINFGYTIDYQFMVYNYQYQDISINNTLKEMGRILQQVLIQFFMHNSQELNIEKVEQIKKTILDIQTGFDKQYIIVLHLLGYTLTKLRKFTKDINVDDILQKLFYQRQICKDELHAQNVDTYILNIIQSHDCAQLQERIILKLLDEQKGNQNNMEEFLLKLKTQNNFYFIKLALENLNCYVDEFIIIDLIKTFYQDWEIIYQFQRLMDKIISYGNFTKIKLKYPRKLEAFQFLINTFPNRFDIAQYIYNMMTDRLFAFQNLDKLQKVQMLPKWQRKILIQLINFCDTLGDLEIIKEYIEGTFQDLNLSRLPKFMDIVRAMTIRLEQLVPDYINLLLL